MNILQMHETENSYGHYLDFIVNDGAQQRVWTVQAHDDGDAWTVYRCSCDAFECGGDCQHRHAVIDQMNQLAQAA